MGSTPEGKLTDQIRRAIAREYPDAWQGKIHGGPYQSGGLPDLLVIYRGHAIGMEIKAARQGESVEHARSRATLRQQAALEKMERSGAAAGVVCSKKEALALMRQVENMCS